MGGHGKGSGAKAQTGKTKNDFDLEEWQSVYQSVRNTGPFVTDVSSKQVGVIYSNVKKGNIDLSQDDVKLLYNHVAGSGFGKYKQGWRDMDSANHKIRMGIEYIFRGKYKKAEKEIKDGLALFWKH